MSNGEHNNYSNLRIYLNEYIEIQKHLDSTNMTKYSDITIVQRGGSNIPTLNWLLWLYDGDILRPKPLCRHFSRYDWENILQFHKCPHLQCPIIHHQGLQEHTQLGKVKKSPIQNYSIGWQHVCINSSQYT